MTDALTGLGNRRALALRRSRICSPSDGPARPFVLALFDLDGFKHYNDTFGHPAGDALLIRLGANLAACLQGRGRAFRMGGDEFCVLIEPGLDDPAALVESAAAALSESGEGFTSAARYGSVAAARGGHRPRRRAAHRRPAHVRPKHAGRAVGRPPEQGRPAARADRAQPDAGRPPVGRRRAGRAHRAPARAAARGDRADPPRRRAARRRQGRDPGRRSSPSPARSTRRSGASSAATR